jgi:hypothetical protein
MIADSIQNPFHATVELTSSDIAGYVKTALNKRGYNDVSMQYNYSDNGSNWDRFATPSTKVVLAGSKGDQVESENMTMDQLCQLVADELRADGHMLEIDTYNQIGVTISYSERERTATGSCTLLIARKR